MPQLSSIAESLRYSGIREIVNLVLASDRDIARLEIGEPGFPTPAHIVEAAATSPLSRVGYTHSAGMQPLREEISRSLGRRYDLDVPFERIVVAQGAGQGISAVLSVLLEPGDEVLVPDPSWPNYGMLVALHGAVEVSYPLRPTAGFLPDVAELTALVTPRTKAIIINSPGNPTGAVFSPELVRSIVEFAAARDIVVISDEVYDELIFEGAPANAAGFGRDNVVSLFSFSKTYAMTGWRVGYALAPEWLAPVLAHVQEPLLSCISSASQAAALAALTGTQEPVAMMRDAYRERRDLAVGILLDGGIAVSSPAGAFYLMVPLAPGADSRSSALDLVKHGVAVAPGTAFGSVAADQLRISLASPPDVIRVGLERLTEWMRRTEGGLALDTHTRRPQRGAESR